MQTYLKTTLAVTLALAGCNAPPSEHGSASQSSKPLGPQTMDIAWPDESTIDGAALRAMVAPEQAHVRASRVPVLVPTDRVWLTRARVIAKEHWTVASASIDGATVTVTATRISHKVRGVEPAEGNRELRGGRGFVTQNEGIWSASWKENQIAYSVEVECASPSSAACESEESVLRIANGLAYVGGGEGGAQ